MRVTKVGINTYGDGLDALYIDGKLVFGGDYYHDKAAFVIDGYMLGLKKMGWKGKVEEIDWDGSEAEEYVNIGNPLPETLTELASLMNVK